MYQYGWFSPNGENVNFGILSNLTFHSLVKKTYLTLTFVKAAALAIKLAEGRPDAGLPPHNEMKKGVERAFRKGNILKDKFWEGIL